MPRFSGPQGRGAMRSHRDKRYREAVARQRECIEVGGLIPHGSPVNGDFRFARPAPLAQFLRRADR